MSSKRWKAVELEIAKYVGGQRRGADFRGEDGGKNDIIKPGWSIEVKHYARPQWQIMVDAFYQAVNAKEHTDDIPIAIIHKKGTRIDKSLVVMDLETFKELFIND